jgi:transcriptional regulator with XRE-family HTH domain
MNAMISFGEAVRNQRVNKGWTLDELAERAGLTGKYIGSIERGERDPGLFVMDLLAKSFGIPLGKLLGSSLKLSERAVEMGRDFDTCDESIQRAVLQLLRAARPYASAHRIRK